MRCLSLLRLRNGHRTAGLIRALLAASVSLVHLATSAAANWRPVGPDGGDLGPVAVAPGGLVYAASGASLFASADGARSWSLRHRFSTPVEALALAPADAGVVYAGADGGVRRSDDGGLIWEVGPAEGAPGTAVTIAVDPGDPDVVWAGTDGGLWLSCDGGGTWEHRAFSRRVVLVTVHPKRAGVLFASLEDDTGSEERGGLFASTDGGTTWVRSATGLEDAPSDAPVVPAVPIRLEFVPQRPGTVWALTDRGLFLSEDDAVSWRPVPAIPVFTSIAVDPADGALLAARTLHGVWRTIDLGGTWEEASAGLECELCSERGADCSTHYWPIARNTLASLGPKELLLGVERRGIWVSRDAGSSWTPRLDGFDATRIAALAGPGGETGALVAVQELVGPLRRTEGGWAPGTGTCGNCGDRRVVGGFDYDCQDFGSVVGGERIFYAGGQGGAYSSSDGGASWSWLGWFSPPPPYAIASPRSAPDVVYLAWAPPVASDDGGASWRQCASLPGEGEYPTALAVDEQNPWHVYAATPSGLVSSTDGCASWRRTALPEDLPAVTLVATHPAAPSLVLAVAGDRWSGQRGTLLRSDDGGATWQVTPPTDLVLSLGFQLTGQRSIFAGTASGAVLHSDDLGLTWETVEAGGLPGSAIGALAVSDDGRVLYAGTEGNGVYELERTPSPLTVEAFGAPTTGHVPHTVTFQADADGGDNPFAYDWDFGDGSEHSTEANPSHTYLEPGSFTATVTVTDADGRAVADSVAIHVRLGLRRRLNALPNGGFRARR